MSTSRMMIEPLSGFSSPISDFRNTDLPVPDGPSRTEISPGGRVRVTSPQMRLPAEGFRQIVDCDLNPHETTPSDRRFGRAVAAVTRTN